MGSSQEGLGTWRVLGGELGKGGGEEVPGARSSKVDQYTGTGTTTHPDSANLWTSAPAVTRDKWTQMIMNGYGRNKLGSSISHGSY